MGELLEKLRPVRRAEGIPILNRQEILVFKILLTRRFRNIKKKETRMRRQGIWPNQRVFHEVVDIVKLLLKIDAGLAKYASPARLTKEAQHLEQWVSYLQSETEAGQDVLMPT